MKDRRWMALASLGILSTPLIAARHIPLLGNRSSPEPVRSDSYWTRTVPPLPEFPRVEHDIEADVAIIGGGFTGLATAYYLKLFNPSLRVVVLEAQRFGSGASSRNSGAVAPRFRGSAPSESSQRGYRLLKAFAEFEDVDFDLQESVPSITLYRRSPNDRKPDLCQPELASAVGSTYYEAAITSSTNSLHPGKLINGLVRANLRLGVELYEWSLVEHIGRSHPSSLQVADFRVLAGDVVLATNGYTPRLGVAANVMTAMHHRVIVTRPLTDSEWELSGLERWPLRFESGGYYTHTVRTTPDRRFFFRHVLGHRAFESTHWQLGEAEARIGHEELVRRYPWLDGVPIEYAWHGLTARTRDWQPVTGRVDDHLYIAAGFNGSGIMPTHYFGYLLAHEILGLAHEDLVMLKPPREHQKIPGEYLRHLLFHGWLMHQRRRER